MRIHTLVATNFRCFEHLTLALDPKATLLIGENGAGKTAVLEAIAIAIGAWLSGTRQATSEDRTFQRGDARRSRGFDRPDPPPPPLRLPRRRPSLAGEA